MDTDTSQPLDKVLDPYNFKMLIHELIKARTPLEDGRSFSYKEVSHPYKDGKTIYVMGRHFPLDEVLKNGNGSCKDCYGRGYYYSEVPKIKLPNPSDFLIQESLLPKDLSDAEQEKWVKEEKTRPNWTIMNICSCAVKKTHKKNPKVLSNAQHNIWVMLDYEIR